MTSDDVYPRSAAVGFQILVEAPSSVSTRLQSVEKASDILAVVQSYRGRKIDGQPLQSRTLEAYMHFEGRLGTSGSANVAFGRASGVYVHQFHEK